MPVAADRGRWLVERLGAIKAQLRTSAASGRHVSGEWDQLQNLFVRLARLGGSLETAPDLGAAVRLERDQARPLVDEIRAFMLRSHINLARPVWAPAPSARDAGVVFFSGSDSTRRALDRVAQERHLVVSTATHPGADTAEARWRDLRAAGLAVFELARSDSHRVEASDPQVYYDLGIAVALGTELLLLAEEGTELPFNIAQDPLYYPADGPGDGFLEDALDEALYRVSVNDSRRSSAEASLEYAERLADADKTGIASVIIEGVSRNPVDPVAAFAALNALGPALGDDRMTVLRSRWPASYPDPDELRCFVIMPFRPELDAVHHLIAEGCGHHGFQCVRGDEAGGSDVILSIWEEIGRAQCVIADLTGLNPNVCLEVGIAHAIGRPARLLFGEGRSEAVERRLFPSIAKRRIEVYDPADLSTLVAPIDAALAEHSG
jgi:hypothetical protein